MRTASRSPSASTCRSSLVGNTPIQVGAVLGADAWPGIFSIAVAGRQAIALDPVGDTVFGAEPLPLSATADSGLPVSFETDGPCRILEGALVTDGAGTCTVTACAAG